MTQPLDLAPIQARHETYATIHSASGVYAHCVAQESADDVPALLAEVTRLRAAVEGRDIRLWLIAQTLTPITTEQDPAGIVGDLGPWLDGPIHPDYTAAYRAAQEG